MLDEIRRVLKPGGDLIFLEHGISPDVKVRKWQIRLNAFEMKMAGGCQLIRDAKAIVGESGYEITSATMDYAAGPKPWSYMTLGKAISTKIEM